VKSRLSISNLPERLKNIIDGYFDGEFKRLKREKERINAPEYEKLYDAPECDISFENALEIEKSSWATTARLIEDMQIEEDVTLEEETFAEGQMSEIADPITEVGIMPYGLSSLEIEYLRAVSEGKSDVSRQIIKELSTLEEHVAERINEAFADNFGDVILEITDNGKYKIIDDYFEEITEWLRSTEK
jgi:hypothetical protein